MKASARKSYGKYKPMVIHPCGRTQILGQRGYVQHWVALTNDGRTYHARRGLTFETRHQAIEYTEKWIERFNAEQARHAKEWSRLQASYAEQRAAM